MRISAPRSKVPAAALVGSGVPMDGDSCFSCKALVTNQGAGPSEFVVDALRCVGIGTLWLRGWLPRRMSVARALHLAPGTVDGLAHVCRESQSCVWRELVAYAAHALTQRGESESQIACVI